MNRKYLAGLIAAIAGGYGLGEVDLNEAYAQTRIARAQVPLGATAGSTLDTLVQEAACGEIEKDAGVNCTVDLIKHHLSGGVNFSWTDDDNDGDNEWVLEVTVSLPGGWTPDD